MRTIDSLGPPAAIGWWWMADGGTTDEAPPWYMAHWDGETLRVYAPTDNVREWAWIWDGEDWVCVNDLGYSEVDPVEWVPVPSVERREVAND